MIVDILVIVLALIAGILGAKKGFVYVICKLVGFILAIVLAFALYKQLSSYLYNNYEFGEKINNSIEAAISNNSNLENEDSSISKVLEKFNLKDRINLSEEKNKVTSQESLTDVIADKLTGYVMNIIAFLIIFMAVIIVVAIVSVILSAVFSIPGLKEINKILGFAIEVILFAIKLCIVLKIISILAPMEFMTEIIAFINKSILVKFLYENNIIIYAVSKINLFI